MPNLFYEKEDGSVSLYVRLVFGWLKLYYWIRWCVVQLGKTVIWMPLTLNEVLQDDLGPDVSRILTGACFMTAFFEIIVGGIALYAVDTGQSVIPIVMTGIVVYLLIGALARYAVRGYGILT
ncbi:MAG: hypothetical protein AAB480_02675 [Patescibacteria group bacterium]